MDISICEEDMGRVLVQLPVLPRYPNSIRLHLLPRVFVCFHLLSPSNSHPVAPAWRRADLVFLSLVGLQVAVSAPVFGSDRGVGAPGSRCVPQCSSALKSANVRLIGISARCCFSAQISSH